MEQPVDGFFDAAEEGKSGGDVSARAGGRPLRRPFALLLPYSVLYSYSKARKGQQ